MRHSAIIDQAGELGTVVLIVRTKTCWKQPTFIPWGLTSFTWPFE